MPKHLSLTVLSRAANVSFPLLVAGLVLVAGSVLVAASARADDTVTLPPLRTGLWERTMTDGSNPAVPSKSCMDQATEEKMLKVGMDKIKSMGGTSSFNGGDGHYQMTSTMAFSGHTMTMVADIQVVGDTKIESVTHVHTDPPAVEGQPADHDVTADSTWVGPCPADMVPGDTIANGRKFNMLTDPPMVH